MKVEFKLDMIENKKKPIKKDEAKEENFRKIIDEKMEVKSSPLKEAEKLEVEKPTIETTKEIYKPSDMPKIEESPIKEDLLNIHNLILTLINSFKELEEMDFNNGGQVEEKLGKITTELDLLKGFLKEENLALLKGEEDRTFNFTKVDRLINEINLNLKDLKSIGEKSLEELIKKAIPTDKSAIKNKDTLDRQIAHIEKIFGSEATKTIKELILKLEDINRIANGGEGIENLNKLPRDFIVKTEKGEKLAIAKEDEVLKEILKEGGQDKNKGEFLMFNKKLEGLKDNPKIENSKIVRKNNLSNDLVKSIKYMNNNGIKELTVKVYPRDLGEIIITVSKDEGLVKANIKANSKETFNVLAQNSNEIKKLLGEGDIKISDIEISLYEDTTFYNESEFKEEYREKQEKGSELKEGEIPFEEEREEDDNRDILNCLA